MRYRRACRRLGRFLRIPRQLEREELIKTLLTPFQQLKQVATRHILLTCNSQRPSPPRKLDCLSPQLLAHSLSPLAVLPQVGM